MVRFANNHSYNGWVPYTNQTDKKKEILNEKENLPGNILQMMYRTSLETINQKNNRELLNEILTSFKDLGCNNIKWISSWQVWM